MWCWYRQVTLISSTVYFLIAWPGGVREGRAAFATLSDSPRIAFLHISKYETDLRIDPKNIIIRKEEKNIKISFYKIIFSRRRKNGILNKYMYRIC